MNESESKGQQKGSNSQGEISVQFSSSHLGSNSNRSFSQSLSQAAPRTPLVVNCCSCLLVVLFVVGVWPSHRYQCAQNNSLSSSLFTRPLIRRPRPVRRERYCSGSTPRPTFLQKHRPQILLCQRAIFKYNTSKHWSTYSIWRTDISRSGKRKT